MRKPHGRLGPLVLVAACTGLGAGCKEDFSDQQFGVLDLASVYPGATTSNPAAGVPDQISPETGYVDGEQAQYYDFGSVPVKRNPLTDEPISAAVKPMYFFFDTSGRPLFSTPARETRDGTDWMRGGQGVLDPNPKDYCAGVPDAKQGDCKKQNDAEKKKAYGVRARDLWKDKLRGGTANYQRPIVDYSPGDTADYTGLWEVYEVIVSDDYVPDAVKHKATMDRAIAAGKMVARSTQKVINCPMLDERTIVSRGITDRANFHPRIELWYRRQLTFCFLANGWETLGHEDGSLIPANNDGQRIDTFDVDRLSVGDGAVKKTELVVPVSKAYTPTVLTFDQGTKAPSVTQIADNVLTRGRPRHTNDDPHGYTPIRWMWNLEVEQTYVSGGLTDVAAIDLTNSDSDGTVHNVPMRGVGVRCGWPPDTTRTPIQSLPSYHHCGRVESPDEPNYDSNDPIDPSNDPVCTKLGLECNKKTCYCDAPFVKYGEVCGPGIARCNPEPDANSPQGYICLWSFGGYCYMRCDPTAANELASHNTSQTKPGEFVDSRCKALPGFRCLGYSDGAARPAKPGICLHICDSNVQDPKQCSTTIPWQAPDKTMMDKDIGAGQTCQDVGIEICQWPDGYTPAD